MKQPVIQSFFFVLFVKQNCLKDQKKSQLMKHLKTNKHLKSMTSDGMTQNVEHLEKSLIHDKNSKRKAENFDLKTPQKFKSNEVLSISEHIIYNLPCVLNP